MKCPGSRIYLLPGHYLFWFHSAKLIVQINVYQRYAAIVEAVLRAMKAFKMVNKPITKLSTHGKNLYFGVLLK